MAFMSIVFPTSMLIYWLISTIMIVRIIKNGEIVFESVAGAFVRLDRIGCMLLQSLVMAYNRKFNKWNC